MSSENMKVTHTQDLLDGKGHIACEGWSDRPVWRYCRKDIKASALRIKGWDYYAVHSFSGGWTVCGTIRDLGYAALLSISFIDYRLGKFAQKDTVKFLTFGRTGLAPSSTQDNSVVFHNRKMRLAFIKNGTRRHVMLNVPDLKLPDGRTGLDANITLVQKKALQSMNIATSWKENRKAFYLNEKVNCMPAEGSIRLGDDIILLSANDAWGVLDWRRGCWMRENTWYWASAGGKTNGHTFGFNLGYGFSDRSPASENCLFHDGKIHKLDYVEFILPSSGFMDTWKFTSPDGRLDMSFRPAVDRFSNTDFKITKSVQHQVFGYFSGQAVLDNGKIITLEDFPGFAEKVYNK